jgi:hypothetical protein
MTISQQGQINTTALVLPDLYVQIVPPQPLLNGVPTNIGAIVGTASWGPVNSPTIIGNYAQYAQTFGPMQPRKFDAGTAVAAAVLQGASNFRIVRVTDGTDTAASVVVQTSCITLSSIYTGSLGNTSQVTLSAGSKASTFKATVAMPGAYPEVFDNVAGTGNAFWVALAQAINQGNSPLRGPSKLITAVAGAGTAAPTLATLSLSGGTDGVTTITSAVLIGQDAIPRSGMYALRNTGTSVAMLADADDSTQWTNQVAFGLSEGIYMIMTGPSGDTIANAVTTKASAGIDSYAAKLLFGDWILFNDTVNQLQRYISPQGFIAGLLSNLSPQNSTLNKQLQGIVGTQKSSINQVYSSADLQALGSAGIDIITNPVPGGSYFGARFGHNTSSNVVIHGDNYTRMTNYIASTINAGMGIYVGQPQTPKLRLQAKATLYQYFLNLLNQGLIGTADGSTPFQVILDNSNNLQSRVALGYMQADIKVIYLSIVEFFIVNLEGGQSVTISRAGNPTPVLS